MMRSSQKSVRNDPALMHEGWIDFARVVCSLGVVFLHTQAGFTGVDVMAGIGTRRAILWSISRLVLGRFAVPVFFMITGFLMLDANREMGLDKVGRHAARIAALIICFGLPMNIVEQSVSGGFSLQTLLKAVVLLVSGRSWGHMWYLYSLLFIYLLVPVLRAITLRTDQRTHLGILAALALFGLVAWPVWHIHAYDGVIPFLNFPPSLFYVAFGGYIHKYWNIVPSWVFPAGVVGLVFTAIGCITIILRDGYMSYWLEDYACPFVALWALCVFCFLRWHAPQFEPGSRVSDAISTLSADSLGIYLTHTIFFNALYKIAHITPINMFWGSCALFWVGGVLFGFVATELLRRVPVYKQLI